MSEAPLRFAYRVVGADGLEAMLPLWRKLRAYHSPLLSRFSGDMPPYDFEARKQELLGKAAAGKIHVELVSIPARASDIAYCVSTVTADGRGEVDSMFVEELFRGRGIGSELMRHALAWLESTGASTKVVTVAHGNEDALAFYQRFGFHPRAVLLQQSEETQPNDRR